MILELESERNAEEVTFEFVVGWECDCGVLCLLVCISQERVEDDDDPSFCSTFRVHVG